MCKVCQLDSKKHSAKQWRLHQQKLKCTFCGKNSPEHSIELWEIHQKAIPTNSKLATMNVGFGPDTLAKIVKWNTVRVNGKDSSHHIEYVPVYMSCNGCGDAMSSTEANIFKTDFSYASLVGADFMRADLIRINFEGADLRNATVNEAGIADVYFEGANLLNADLFRLQDYNMSDEEYEDLRKRGAKI